MRVKATKRWSCLRTMAGSQQSFEVTIRVVPNGSLTALTCFTWDFFLLLMLGSVLQSTLLLKKHNPYHDEENFVLYGGFYCLDLNSSILFLLNRHSGGMNRYSGLQREGFH